MYNFAAMPEVRSIHPSKRDRLAHLINERAVFDAMAGYYALHHPADRVSLYGFYPNDDQPTAFLVVAQTGLDLFRPLAIPFAGHAEPLMSLLRSGLKPGRPVLIDLPIEQRDWAQEAVSLEAPHINEIYRLDPDRFELLINVLIMEISTPTGWPRFEIQSRRGDRASAGVNWLGPYYAEVYVDADEAALSRNFGQSLLATITGRLLEAGKIPLLRIAGDDVERVAVAINIGYRPTGVRTLAAQAMLKPDARQSGGR
jgi:hypothetical protein